MHILVTRPAGDGKRTAERLRALGHVVTLAPVLEIGRTDAPVPAAPYDIIVVTSVNGAACLPALAGWQDRIVYAVGPRSAEAVRSQGEPRLLRVAGGDAVSLGAMIRAEQPTSRTLLHVTGVDHKPEPDVSLRAAGFDVVTWTAYEAIAVAELPPAASAALDAARLDAALHYSRRSAATLTRLAKSAGLGDRLRALPHFCLSADVAEPLRAFGAGTVAIAAEPSESALLALLPAPDAGQGKQE